MPIPQNPSAEAQLVRQAIHGDKQAFGQLFEWYYESILRYFICRTNERADAEDMSELVFLKAWQYLPSFGKRGKGKNFRAWLYRIAHNALIDFYRTKKTDCGALEDFPDPEGSIPAQDAYINRETNDEIRKTIRRLDETAKHVVISRFIAGLTPKEIAHTLGVSEGHVRIIQYRAIQKIRKMLGEMHE